MASPAGFAEQTYETSGMNAFDAGRPNEGSGLSVPRPEEIDNGALQLVQAAKDPAPHGLLFEFDGPTFDQVEPAGAGGDEVQHEPGGVGASAAPADDHGCRSYRGSGVGSCRGEIRCRDAAGTSGTPDVACEDSIGR